MLITKSIKQYIVYLEDTVLEALKKINSNKLGTVFVLDYNGILEGVVTDGDFRRWVVTNTSLDLSDHISSVMNKKFVTCMVNDDPTFVRDTFSEVVKIIPIIATSGHLTSVAIQSRDGVQISNFTISDNSPCFIIAEIGNNHNGDVELAKKLVDLAIDAGADCVKFQMRNIESLYKNSGKSDDKSADLGAQYTLDLLSRFQLTNDELIEVFDYCRSKGIISLCTPWDLHSLEVLEDYGMDAYKVSSADLTNTELLEALAATGKPLICSTGMSTESEIKYAVNLLHTHAVQYVLLHCNSTYPTPDRDVNLRYLSRLCEIAVGPVGYSGHERGYLAPILAVSLGASVVEKHFTIDKEMEGNDHKVSLLPEEFSEMVKQIRLAEIMIGSDAKRTISQGESMNREILAKSLVANQPIRSGEIIVHDMIEVKSPGQGLQPYHINDLIGKKAQRDFVAGDYFYMSDITETVITPRVYKFKRPFGIPVRYHDFTKLTSNTNVDFIEFHLSYNDLKVDIDELLDINTHIGFSVHSPELFAGDHILDLSSGDNDYREHSINELQRVIDITRSLKKYFPKTSKPVIITNIGGFNKTGFLPKEKKLLMYERVHDALDRLDKDGVEVIIQTMPPFPWHFGGQSFHNLFVDPVEIAEFCDNTGYRMCFDISHSQMACNHYEWSMDSFISEIGKYVAYLHVVDALGVDGEGVQIGKGNVDFKMLGKKLDDLMPRAPFIPEIWQGHKQQGSGFWSALDFLEKYL